MRKIISTLTLAILTLLIITACSNKDVIKHNYTYKGENEFWTAEYKVDGEETFTKSDGKTKYDSNYNETFTVTYKKDKSKLDSLKHIEISYKSSVSEGQINHDYDDNSTEDKGTYTMKSKSTGGAVEKEDEVIEVTINLDGKIETIKLKNE